MADDKNPNYGTADSGFFATLPRAGKQASTASNTASGTALGGRSTPETVLSGYDSDQGTGGPRVRIINITPGQRSGNVGQSSAQGQGHGMAQNLGQGQQGQVGQSSVPQRQQIRMIPVQSGSQGIRIVPAGFGFNQSDADSTGYQRIILPSQPGQSQRIVFGQGSEGPQRIIVRDGQTISFGQGGSISFGRGDTGGQRIALGEGQGIVMGPDGPKVIPIGQRFSQSSSGVATPSGTLYNPTRHVLLSNQGQQQQQQQQQTTTTTTTTTTTAAGVCTSWIGRERTETSVRLKFGPIWNPSGSTSDDARRNKEYSLVPTNPDFDPEYIYLFDDPEFLSYDPEIGKYISSCCYA